MAAPSLGTLVAIGLDVLRTSLSEKRRTLLARIGDVLSEVVEADNVEFWQQVGFISRPPQAAPGRAACQVVVLRRGARDVIIASRDLRGQELVGKLADGETCIYAAGTDGGGQARIILKANGSINLYTREGNQPGGMGMALMLNSVEDSIVLTNSKGFGLVIDKDGARLTTKAAAVNLTASGDCSMVGKGDAQVDGKTILIGSTMVPGVNNAVTGPTGISAKASAKTFIE